MTKPLIELEMGLQLSFADFESQFKLWCGTFGDVLNSAVLYPKSNHLSLAGPVRAPVLEPDAGSERARGTVAPQVTVVIDDIIYTPNYVFTGLLVGGAPEALNFGSES